MHYSWTRPKSRHTRETVDKDIVSKIVLVSKIIGKAISVLSVLGPVQDCYLLHSVVICVICDPCLCWTAGCSVVDGVGFGPLIAATYRQEGNRGERTHVGGFKRRVIKSAWRQPVWMYLNLQGIS